MLRIKTYRMMLPMIWLWSSESSNSRCRHGDPANQAHARAMLSRDGLCSERIRKIFLNCDIDFRTFI